MLVNNLATKSSLTAIKNKIPDINGFVKLSDYSTEITTIKNDYVTKVVLDSKINDLKNQHISDEVKKVDDKVVKNSTNIFLNNQTSLQQNKNILDDLRKRRII